MEIPPPGTTWLDVLTFLIALAGLGIALLNARLTMQRDREARTVRIALSVVMDKDFVSLRVLNIGRRPVTIEAAGFTTRKGRAREPFAAFKRVNFRRAGSTITFLTSDPPVPATLEPDAPPYFLDAPKHKVKAEFVRQPPAWAWVETSLGSVEWAEVPGLVAAEILATKVRKKVEGPYGDDTEVEVEASGESDDAPA